MTAASERVVIGLGSNLGDRRANLSLAVRRLNDHGAVGPLTVSRLWVTAPWGGPPGQGEFLNAAVAADVTGIEPRELLRYLLETERMAGRLRGVRNGPRSLDLDILLFGDRVVEEPGLTVPHIAMHERSFVLGPASDVAGDFIHPDSGRPSERSRSGRAATASWRCWKGRIGAMPSVIRTVFDLRSVVGDWRRAGRSVGFVPTMGALHEGHASLVRSSVEECDRTVVSIFVNPLQFDRADDLSTYPRTEEQDRALLSDLGADVVFMPNPDEVYPEGFATHVTQTGLTEPLCGATRPGHFDGVLTVVLKLFNMVAPDRAYFGRRTISRRRSSVGWPST